jgi:spermidine/putrescine-binding protein
MKAREFARRFACGHLGRRQLLQGLAAVGLTATVFPVVLRPAKADADLTVFTWADYDNALYHQKFIDKNGGSPEFAIFGESEEALQKLRGGFTPDLAHPCTSDVRRWKDAGVIRPVDTSRLGQWDNLFPSLKKIRGIEIDGAYYHVPWDWGNESILYRTDLVELKEDSLSLMLDERYKGRIAMFNSVDSMAGLGGKLAGVGDPFAMTDEEIARTREVWRQIHANLRFYWDDSTQLSQAIKAEELVAGWAWNEAVLQLKQEGVPVEYMKPKEGIFTWVCGLALVANAPGSEDRAYDFLNAMLDPESGKNLIEQFGYGHSNRKSFELVEPDLVQQMGLADLDGMLATTNFYEEMPAETREKLITIFDEIKAGI